MFLLLNTHSKRPVAVVVNAHEFCPHSVDGGEERLEKWRAVLYGVVFVYATRQWTNSDL